MKWLKYACLFTMAFFSLSESKVVGAPRDGGNAGPRPTHIEPPAPITNLLERAEEGIQRADWKFAIDSLQRIIDDPDSGLISASGREPGAGEKFIPVRELALSRLASLPADGLRAYRLLYDGKAKGIFERAKSARDENQLRSLLRRFPLSSYGDDAADLLASWTLDQGRPLETIAILNELKERRIDTNIPSIRINGKLAAAYAMLGRLDDARRCADAVGNDPQPSGSAPRVSFSDDVLRLLADAGHSRANGSGALERFGISGTRSLRMGEVSPSINAKVPWHFTLPGSSPDAWRDTLVADPEAPLRLPVTSPVIAGDRLFVRTESGCVALNVIDLTPEWIKSDAPMKAPDLPPDPNGGWYGEPARALLFDDHVAGLTGVCDGSAFVIDRGSPSPMIFANRRGMGARIRNWSGGVIGSSRLSAYDVITGALQWRLDEDTFTPGESELLLFRATPVAAANRLWVPFTRDNDLMLCGINPRNGKAVHSIFLGGIDQPENDATVPLIPAVAENTIYLPSGRGVLFAVDLSERRLKWATLYADDPLPGRYWHPSSPMVVGGLVILPPPDAEALMAFDAITGERRWSVGVGSDNYLIAADAQFVWTGGRSISCVKTATGELVWSSNSNTTPTGRAILAGDELQVPTTDGLVRFDSSNGTLRGQWPLDDSQAPLGNLLSVGGSLYSVDRASARRFPDVEKTYEIALRRAKDSPSNALAQIELAWLEILRDNPARANDILNAVASAGDSLSDSLRVSLSNSRVEAKLRLVDTGELTEQANMQLVREARAEALRAEDKLRCDLKLADQLRKAGRAKDAYETLWSLGSSPDSNVIQPWENLVLAPARLPVSLELARLSAELNPADRAAVEQAAVSRVNQLAEQTRLPDHSVAARSELIMLADLAAPGAVSQRALSVLAEWMQHDQRNEQAEQFWRETSRMTGDRSLSIRALQRLCDLYADNYWWASSKPLLEVVDRLNREFGHDVVSETKPEPASGSSSVSQSPPMKVADWIEGKWGDVLADARKEAAASESLDVESDTAWRLETPDDRNPPALVHFDDEFVPAIDDRIMLNDGSENVVCMNARNGAVIWRAPTRFDGSNFDDDDLMSRRSARPVRAVADGQIGLFVSSDSLTAIGLASGRRLWAISRDDISGFFDQQPDQNRNQRQNRMARVAVQGGFQNFEDENTFVDRRSDFPLAAKDGRFAIMVGIGRLAMYRLHDATMLWERDLRGERVADIEMHDDAVLTLDPGYQRLHIIDQKSGRLRQRHVVRQPHPDQRIRPVVTGGVVCSIDSVDDSDFAFGVDLMQATDDVLWRFDPDKPIHSIFVPKEGYVGFSLIGGDVRIVDARTGELAIDRRVSGAQAVNDGLMVDGTLVTRHLELKNGRQYPVLSGIDIATGEVAWQRQDLAPTSLQPTRLRAIGRKLPVMLDIDGIAKYNRGVSLDLIDIGTGASDGLPVELLPPGTQQRISSEFRVRQGAIIVWADRVICGIGLSSSPVIEKGGM